MGRPELVPMGRSAGAFGVKGELKVHSFARRPDIFARVGEFFAGAEPSAARRYTLDGLRRQGERLVFQVRELNSREEAQALSGAWIYLERRHLPPLGEGEYYWADLKGCRVLLADGRELGRVRGVMDHGAHELWEVAGGPQGREALIPIVEGVIQSMDLAAGLVVVELPEGLLESQGWPEQGAGGDEPQA